MLTIRKEMLYNTLDKHRNFLLGRVVIWRFFPLARRRGRAINEVIQWGINILISLIVLSMEVQRSGKERIKANWKQVYLGHRFRERQEIVAVESPNFILFTSKTNKVHIYNIIIKFQQTWLAFIEKKFPEMYTDKLKSKNT